MQKKLRRLRKRVALSRIMVTLAACSFALVFFSATVYASVIPSVLLAPVHDLPLTGTSAEDASDSQDGWSGAGAQAGVSNDADADEAFGALKGAGADDGILAKSVALPGSPSFGSLSSLVRDVSERVVKAPSDDIPEQDASGLTQPSGTPSQPEVQVPPSQVEEQLPSTSDTGLSAAEEAAIHAHLVTMYEKLPSFYNQICACYEELYGIIGSGAPADTHIHYSSIDPHDLQTNIERERVNVYSDEPRIPCGGPDDPRVSKWYSAAEEIFRLYENLTNACSPLWETDGFTIESAVFRLERYLDADGKIAVLAEFERNYPNVRL